ncbi:hypothetical protein D1872_273360 [compost metagenome]
MLCQTPQFQRSFLNDLCQFSRFVKLQPKVHAEAVSKRRRDHPRTRRRPDQREARQIEFDRLCSRAASDDDIESKILHRRIEYLLYGGRESVNLVDKEDISLFEVG